MPNTGDWQGQYVVWPRDDVYPDSSLYPYNVHRVTGNEDVWSADGKWRWEKITDTSSVKAMMEAAHNLRETVSKIPTTLDMVVGTADGKVVNATVVQQLFARYVTAQDGEFVKITSGQIAAGSITADMIQAGAIDGKVITGATVQTAPVGDNPRVFFNSAGIFATNSDGQYVFRVLNTGSVTIRGNLGLENSWYESNLVDMGSFTVDYVDGNQESVYSGPGLSFRPKVFPTNQTSTVSVARRGMVGPAFTPSSLSIRYPNSGFAYTTGTFGTIITSPVRTQGASPSTLRVEEGGLLWTAPRQSSTTYSSYGSAAMKVWVGGFMAQGGTGVGSYRISATPDRANYRNSAIQLLVGADVSESAGRVGEIILKPGFFTVRGAGMGSIEMAGGGSNQKGYAYLRASGERFSNKESYTNNTQMTLNANYCSTSDPDPFAVVQKKYYSNATRNNKYFYVSGGTNDNARVHLTKFASGIQHDDTHYIMISSNGFYAAGGKNFIMPVPGITEKSGLWLRHGATESPHHGIEYWKVVELDDQGEAEWVLPEYVAPIASDYADKAVFVTVSEGSANATLVEDGKAFRVVVRNGTPGATANLLVKLGRKLHKGYTDDGHVELEPMPDSVWVFPPTSGDGAGYEPDPFSETDDKVLTWDGTIDGHAYGPQDEETSRGTDIKIVREVLNDYSWDPTTPSN